MDELKKPAFWLWVVTTLLIVIVAIGQWQIYPRLEKVESILGSLATQQSQQK